MFRSMNALKHCPWCGSKPRMGRQWSNPYGDWGCEGSDAAWISCSKCTTGTGAFHAAKYDRQDGRLISGYEDFEGEAIKRWEERNVTVPFNITLPQNHMVLERSIVKRTAWSKTTTTKYLIPQSRQIGEHFHRAMNWLFDFNNILPVRFRVSESQFVYWSHCRLVSFSRSNKGWNGSPDYGDYIYEFTTDTSVFTSFDSNKVDSAWLKRPAGSRAPISDVIFAKMGLGSQEEEDR